MRRRPVVLTGALAAGLLLAACSSAGEDAVPGSSPTTTNGSPDSSASASLPAPNAVADRRLTDAETKAALVTTGDLPDGWDQVGTDVTRATLSERILTGTTEPASCQPLVDAADPSDTTTLAVSAFRRTVAGPWLAESVASYPDAASARVAAVAQAAAACPKFTLVASNGDRVEVTVSSTGTPAGQDSAAFRLSGKRGIVPVVADVVLVARGHTVVGVVGGGVATLDGSVVSDVAAASVAKLPAA